MSKGRILVVEDDFDISNMLRIYFGGQGYSVEVASKGNDALVATRRQAPSLIVLDINLPDISGYDVCKQLRTTTRTRHIPIIFLTQKDERSDKIIGLELGADDYVTKPFDIEELKLRVQNAIKSSEESSKRDSISGLPTGTLIEEHLRGLMRNPRDWVYIDMKINNFESFSEIYGWAAADEVIRFTALLLGETIEKYGTIDDYLGHPGRDNFVIITHANDTTTLIDKLKEAFAEKVKQHYSFIDRERGYMLMPDGAGEKQIDLMALAMGHVSTRTHQFSDIREITELAAEDRRRGISGDTGSRSDTSILTSW
jgi:PleD family two-component response regulator